MIILNAGDNCPQDLVFYRNFSTNNYWWPACPQWHENLPVSSAFPLLIPGTRNYGGNFLGWIVVI